MVIWVIVMTDMHKHLCRQKAVLQCSPAQVSAPHWSYTGNHMLAVRGQMAACYLPKPSISSYFSWTAHAPPQVHRQAPAPDWATSLHFETLPQVSPMHSTSRRASLHLKLCFQVLREHRFCPGFVMRLNFTCLYDFWSSLILQPKDTHDRHTTDCPNPCSDSFC